MDYITLEKIVKEREKPSRFEHSLGVVEVSEVLARRFRLDVELSRMIGIFQVMTCFLSAGSGVSP